MPLESTGTLYLVGSSAAPTRSIQYELEGAYTGIGLLEAITLSGESWDSMLDFYGYSAGSTIIYDYSNSITWAFNTLSHRDGYQSLVFSGRVSGDVITLNLESNFYETGGAVVLDVYYSINSTSSWNLILSRSATDSYDLIYIPGVDYNDVVRVRINLETIKAGQGNVTISLIGGSFTSGSGTVTASGSTAWYTYVDDI